MQKKFISHDNGSSKVDDKLENRNTYFKNFHENHHGGVSMATNKSQLN